MNAWQKWVQRPQNLWLRKALFQVHLWVGIALGIYLLLISLSGSAIVYRPQMMRALAHPQQTVAVSGPKLSREELVQRAQQANPGYQADDVYPSRRPDLPTLVWLDRGSRRISRLFNPYTGEELGDPTSFMEKAVEWLVDFHDNLLAGQKGRFWNGIGSIAVTVTSLIGLFLWWPGVKNWRRSTVINWKASFPLFNWTLHSAVGFWCSLIMLMWGISGIYFSFPDPFYAIFGDSQFVAMLVRFHFGRFGRLRNAPWYYRYLSALWVVFGLIPATLAVTGFLMWWNRVLRKKILQPE